MRFRPIRLAAPHGINREQQVMQQNQKLGTQPNAKCRAVLPVPFEFQKNISECPELFRELRNGL
jgi:hypothetical protein